MNARRTLILCLIALVLAAASIARHAPARAAVYWASADGIAVDQGVRSKQITVCFVADAVTARPDRVRQITSSIKEFERAANIRFIALNGRPLAQEAGLSIGNLTCPPPTKQPNGFDHYAGDIRVVIPTAGFDATTPVPGNGCDNDQLTSDPDAVSWSNNRIDIFWRGWDDTLRHKSGDGKDWSLTESLGGVLTSGPAVASRGVDNLDVFVRGLSGGVWHRGLNGKSWTNWRELGGTIVGAPDAVSWGNNRIDLFARWTDNTIRHMWSTDGGATWSAWENLGGLLTSGPAVASWDTDRLDVFARGADNALWHQAWNGNAWSGWHSLGGVITSDPDAVSWGPNRIDVFARGQDNGLWRRVWNGSAWVDWAPLGGTLTSGPTASSRESNRIDVFYRGQNSALWRQWLGTGNDPSNPTNNTVMWRGPEDVGDNRGWGSWSNAPWDLNQPTRRACRYNLKLGDDPWNRTPYLNHTLHEFGHALGLAHEHARNDTANLCGFGGDVSAGLMTRYDPQSVMHYSAPTSCPQVIGNHADTGLSDLDRLALHILYPEDNRIAEYVGTAVVRQNDTLRLQSDWQARGANMSFVARNFVWKLNGNTVSKTPNLQRWMTIAGVYRLEMGHSDFLGRTYTTTGTIRVLDAVTYTKQIVAPSAATSVLLIPTSP